MAVDILDMQGATVGSVELPSNWFAGKVNIGLMHDVVTAQQAAARQGTHKTKTRGEVRGGGKKPWNQKGTGRARHGSTRSPIWVGGGTAHGRTPSDWSKRINKKVKRAALASALTDRANNDAVKIVRGLGFDAPKTKDAVAFLAAAGLTGQSVLVVMGDGNVATRASFNNLTNVHTLVIDQLNVRDVLVKDVVLFDEAALDLIATGRRVGGENPGMSEPDEAPVAASASGADDSRSTDEEASS